MEEIILCLIPEKPKQLLIANMMDQFSSAIDSSKALTFPPHITIVSRFRTNNFEAIKNVVQKYSNKKIHVDLTGLHHFDDPPILFLKPKDAESIKKIHYDLIEIVSPLRLPWVRESFKQKKYSDLQATYIQEYGSPYVKEFYNPHLTLAGPDVSKNKFLKETKSKKQTSIVCDFKGITILRKVDGQWLVEI